MASLNTQTFSTLVSNWVAAAQAQATSLIDAAIGSILLAMAEAQGQVVLWLQGLILQLLRVTRLATSSGADIDSFIADFAGTGSGAAFGRFPATFAVGAVTFSRLSTGTQVVVPIGSTVQTQDGVQTYKVIVDVTNIAYNAGLGGYVLAPGTSFVTVPVQALTAGSAGNAVGGSVTVITSALPGIDSATNALAFAEGADAETDASVKARFPGWVMSLARGTAASIQAAIADIQPGAQCVVVENTNYGGGTNNGYCYLIVDDGSGAPPTSFLDACAAAAAAYRGLGVRVDVFAPILVPISTWAMTVNVAAGYSKPTVGTAVQTAVNAYMASLELGQTLYASKMIQVAMETPGVASLDKASVTIGGSSADLTVNSKQIIRPTIGAGTVTTP